MKKIFSIVLIFCSFILIAKNKKKNNKKEQVIVTTHNHADTVVVSKPEKPDAVIGAPLFDFSVLTSKETVFTNKDIPKNNSFILMLFNPGCGHCIATTNALKYKIKEFKNTTILLVTGNNLFNNLQEFIKDAGLTADIPITVAAEMGDMTKKIFEYKGIPQVMVYNKNKILQQTFYKEVDIDSVQYYLKK
jgi:hypothetical protein